MAFCSQCGRQLEDDARFCSGCGAPVQSTGEKRKESFQGEIIKCPNCGEQLRSFQATCPACGYEFRNVKASSAVSEFSKTIEKLEKSRKPKSKLGSIASQLGIGSTDTTDEQVISHIRNFNVPNTKEDVAEFMVLASSNIDYTVLSAYSYMDAHSNSITEFNALKAKAEAWIAKVEQVYQKASISFGDDKGFERIKEIYCKTSEEIKKARKKRNHYWIKFILAFAGCFIMILTPVAVISISDSVRINKMEKTVIEIQNDVEAGNYETALIKANTLHITGDHKEEWDEQREYLIDLIERKIEESK